MHRAQPLRLSRVTQPSAKNSKPASAKFSSSRTLILANLRNNLYIQTSAAARCNYGFMALYKYCVAIDQDRQSHNQPQNRSKQRKGKIKTKLSITTVTVVTVCNLIQT
jgi:hypothetical protein